MWREERGRELRTVNKGERQEGKGLRVAKDGRGFTK